MPSDKMIKKSPLKAKQNLAITPASGRSSGAARENCSPSSLPITLTLTPRFTSEEKQILFNLFRQYEDVIDIKNRKKQKRKPSIRDAWQSIVDGFNNHPNVAIRRNFTQIQKFWLNARLRKQYHSKTTQDAKPRAASSVTTKQPAMSVSAPIKCEPEFSIPTNDSSDRIENIDEYEEIEQQRTSVSDPITIESLEDPTEVVQIEESHEMQDKSQRQKHQNTSNQGQQQINVDHISADKLTLYDLLQFKNTRPPEEIIFQIKQPDGSSITLPSPNRITAPDQPSTYNQIITEIKGQPHIQVQNYQAPIQITPQQIEQQYNATNSTYYTYATQNQPDVTTPLDIGKVNSTETGNSTVFVVPASYEAKFNYFKLKETELRNKEVQLLSEQKRIELFQMQEELRHKKEMHLLQVEEMQIKIRILCEEEKQLAIKAS